MAAIAEQDVLEGCQPVDTDPYELGVQSVPAQGVRSLVTYWRQSPRRPRSGSGPRACRQA